MLRASELIPALRLAQDAGERPYGHFDHDSNASSGPQSADEQADFLAVAAVGYQMNFDIVEDPRTGEQLIRRR